MILLPRISRQPWGGATDDGERDVNGWSFTIEWLGLFVEFCIGRVR